MLEKSVPGTLTFTNLADPQDVPTDTASRTLTGQGPMRVQVHRRVSAPGR
jgi:hypothetical protein